MLTRRIVQRRLAIVLDDRIASPLEMEQIAGGRAVIIPLVRRGLEIDEAGARRSRERLADVPGAVEAAMADGRRYLVGDRLTAADLTFASL